MPDSGVRQVDARFRFSTRGVRGARNSEFQDGGAGRPIRNSRVRGARFGVSKRGCEAPDLGCQDGGVGRPIRSFNSGVRSARYKVSTLGAGRPIQIFNSGVRGARFGVSNLGRGAPDLGVSNLGCGPWALDSEFQLGGEGRPT